MADVPGWLRDVQGVQVSAPVIGHVSPAVQAKWEALGESLKNLRVTAPFTSTAKYLWHIWLGQSLAVAGALCEAHQRGFSHGYHDANLTANEHDWQPGCGWSL